MRTERLPDRLAALAAAVEAATGRVDETVLSQASDVVRRAGERVGFSGGHTVVALAGATGSGKSSLFNALSGTELAQVATRRPTTSRTMAVGWGSELPHDLLDWIDVPRRHLLPEAHGLGSLVLLDLPDHDSTEVSHRLAVDRLVEVVDALVWVVDPQKYADAALHDRYLAPLSGHAEVMMVVLNQADQLSGAELEACTSDLRRLLDAEGLRATPLMTASALRGTGVAELRATLARTVRLKQAAVRRWGADVTAAATDLVEELGSIHAGEVSTVARTELEAALAQAAGVPVVVDAVRDAWQRRGAQATGWPLVSWVARLRPDPLRRLRLAASGTDDAALTRTALPAPDPVQRARISQALRRVSEQAAEGLGEGWAAAIGAAVPGPEVADRLDGAIAATDLSLRRPWWWTALRFLQWVLVLTVLAGGVWLATGLFTLTAGLLPAPQWSGVPAPWWLVIGGLMAGIGLAMLSRPIVLLGAKAKARSADRALRRSIAAMAATEVIEPITVELTRHTVALDRARAALR